MQVRKFEASSMKEALELVRSELGPEAIILSAREQNQSFGLMKKKGVEVTAAVSENQLRKKAVAESKITLKDKQTLQNGPATVQKKFIAKSYDRSQLQQGLKPALRYVDIVDDEETSRPNSSQPPAAAIPAGQSRSTARVQNAVKSAVQASRNVLDVKPQTSQAIEMNSNVVQQLQSEIQYLRKTIQEMKPKVDQRGLPSELGTVFDKLKQTGISEDLLLECLSEAQRELGFVNINKRHLVEAWVTKYLLHHTQIVSDPLAKRIHAFLGGSGQGKTSMLVKWASHLIIREKKQIAILTTDTQKVGAVEQLKIYSQILNVPFGVIRGPQDWTYLLSHITNVDYILVDFQGSSLRNEVESESLKRLLPPAELDAALHLVQSVSSREVDAQELVARYKSLSVTDLIFTNIDQTSTHGTMFNLQKQFRLPIHSFGVGPMIPEDFELANRERVIDLIFKITSQIFTDKEVSL
jgi:flagellar biosynthesis protein FlhF